MPVSFPFSRFKGELIISCQALEDEPLHGSSIMAAWRALDLGAYAVVVGSAITRPQLITRSYTRLISQRSR